ncbi:hypothetical protein JCM11641_006862 [Rhodosporidiobolus odoratus]
MLTTTSLQNTLRRHALLNLAIGVGGGLAGSLAFLYASSPCRPALSCSQKPADYLDALTQPTRTKKNRPCRFHLLNFVFSLSVSLSLRILLTLRPVPDILFEGWIFDVR